MPAKLLMHHGHGKEEKAHQAASEVLDSILSRIHLRIDGVFLRPRFIVFIHGINGFYEWYPLVVPIYGITGIH